MRFIFPERIVSVLSQRNARRNHRSLGLTSSVKNSSFVITAVLVTLVQMDDSAAQDGAASTPMDCVAVRTVRTFRPGRGGHVLPLSAPSMDVVMLRALTAEGKNYDTKVIVDQ